MSMALTEMESEVCNRGPADSDDDDEEIDCDITPDAAGSAMVVCCLCLLFGPFMTNMILLDQNDDKEESAYHGER